MPESSTSTLAQAALVSAATQATPANGGNGSSTSSSSSNGGVSTQRTAAAVAASGSKGKVSLTNGAGAPSEALIERALEIVDQRLRAKLGATSIEAYLAKTAPPLPRRDASVGPSYPGLPNILPPLGPPPPSSLLRVAGTQTGETAAQASTSAAADAGADKAPTTLGKRARSETLANGASPSPPAPSESPKRQARESSSSSGPRLQPFVRGVDDVEGVSCISRLNEYAQKNKIDLPTYESVTLQKAVGPDGLKHYVTCFFAGMKFEEPEGYTRKHDSKEAAARLALVHIVTRPY